MNVYPIDTIYLAASSRDARLTRICVASIRYFYPDVPIKILPGDILQSGLAQELKAYWNVEISNILPADYGWGYVKIEPLFGSKGEKFLVMDVDTVFTGYVLELRAESNALFLVDNEPHTDAEFKKLYYDWDELKKIDSEVQSGRLAFSGGQWFGTAGYFTREDFDPWITWTFPRKQKFPNLFFGGEQGVVSLVVNKKEALENLTVDRTTIMLWPGNLELLKEVPLELIASRSAPPLVIHWAGMKKIRMKKMVGSDILMFFEKYYYSSIPYGRIRRIADNFHHFVLNLAYRVVLKIKIKASNFLHKRNK